MLLDGKRLVNIDECTVLYLVTEYKSSGRNITIDNFFTSMQLVTKLSSWNITIVNIVKKTKRILPLNM